MPDISFVIPAFNEARFLPATLQSIRTYAPATLTHEVIVVDHASTDNTVALARAAGAQVYSQKTATIGALRNLGVRHARGAVVVFIDADVTLTEEWGAAFPAVLADLLRNERRITGAKCDVPVTASWISRFWFRDANAQTRPTHLGTGHLITTLALFRGIDGFDETLETGEDYDFCTRARRYGADIVAQPKLRVLHHGVPSGIRAFVRREAWHGRSDWSSLATVRRSKVALATLAFIVLHIGLAIGVVWNRDVAIFAAVGILSLCALSSFAKYRRSSARTIAFNIAIFYFYYLGRAGSLWKALRQRRLATHRRAL